MIHENGKNSFSILNVSIRIIIMYDDADMAAKLSGIKPVIITRENLKILLSHYSFNEYQDFYDEHFMSIPEFDIDGATLFEEYDTGDGE